MGPRIGMEGKDGEQGKKKRKEGNKGGRREGGREGRKKTNKPSNFGLMSSLTLER
jgi:hypothetical protein